MKTRADYDAAIDAVASVIDAWDPYSLLADGAPRDEFAAEVGQLVTRIPAIRSPEDAAREIASVFSAYFVPEDFTADSCLEVGARLHSRLKRAGLLATCDA